MHFFYPMLHFKIRLCMVYMNVLVMYRNNVLCLLYVIFFFHVCKFKALFKKVFQSSSSCSKMIIFSVDFFSL